MSNARLDNTICQLDPEVSGRAGYWQLGVEDMSIVAITDQRSHRMRIVAPVAETMGPKSERLRRMMQANFDSTLDASYSSAKGIEWSAFSYLLGSPTDRDFLSGIGQVFNVPKTLGPSYSSGVPMFCGGDVRNFSSGN